MFERHAFRLTITGLCIIIAAACSERSDQEMSLATAGDLTITRAVIPAPVTPTDRQAALYMTIRNSGAEPDIVVSLSSPAADSITLHTMEHDGGMMRMVPLGPLTLPAGENTILEPGRRHAMLEGIRQQLQVGDTIRVLVRFANSGSTEVSVPVVRYDQISES